MKIKKVTIHFWIEKSTSYLSGFNWNRTQNHLVLKRTWFESSSFVHGSGFESSWFLNKLGSGFESNCSHLNFRFRSCFELYVLWHSGNYRVWIHFEFTRTWHVWIHSDFTHTWHDKKIQYDLLIQEISQLKRGDRKKEPKDYQLLKRYDVVQIENTVKLIYPVAEGSSSIKY